MLIARLGTSFFILLLCVGCGESPSNEGEIRRQVILISLDNLSADHLPSYGYERETAPGLTKWFGESCLFENCIAAANWTLPSHMSMLTGVRPRRHGIVEHARQDPQVPLISEIIAEHGIATGAFVNHTNVSKTFGFSRGFDTFFQDLNGDDPTEVMKNAKSWIVDQKEHSFFAFVHLFSIHWPHLPEQLLGEDYVPQFDTDYEGSVKGLKGDVNRLMAERTTDQDSQDLEHLKALYDEDIFALDLLLNRFLEDLAQSIDLDDVLIIFTSDHGEAFKEHGYYGHGVSFNRPEVNVPLAMRWPKKLTPTRISEGHFTTLDLAPTILSALDIQQDEEETERLTLEGIDLFTVLRSGAKAPERLLLSESSLPMGSFRFDRFTISNGHYKYIYFPEVRRFEKEFGEELYDLRDDPSEERSLAKLKTEPLAAFRDHAKRMGYFDSDVFVIAFAPQPRPLEALITVKGGLISPETLKLTTFRDEEGRPVAPDWVKLPLEDKLYSDGIEVESIKVSLPRSDQHHALFFRAADHHGMLYLQGLDSAVVYRADGTQSELPETGLYIKDLETHELRFGDSIPQGEIAIFRSTIKVHPDLRRARQAVGADVLNFLREAGYVDDEEEGKSDKKAPVEESKAGEKK